MLFKEKMSFSPQIVFRSCRLRTVLLIVTFMIVTLQYLVNFSIHIKQRSTPIAFWAALQNMSGIYAMTTRLPRNLSECPIIPPDLQGRIVVNTEISAWAHIEEENPLLEPGGRYRPRDCIARNKVAIVIPYRDREIHLKMFLRNLHPFLQRQQLDYGIYVVEMAAGIQFNRALLMNVGFVEALKKYDYQCFIFHDVDLLPEDDRNLYTCPSMPRHMSTAIDKHKYRLPYPQIFGGVSAMSTDHFRYINGFSNLYFGWGGEDDDMYRRILYGNLTVTRYSNQVARYKMLVHKKSTGNPQRFKLLKTVKMRQEFDGITSLKYKIIGYSEKPLYTWIYVSVNMTEIMNDVHPNKRPSNSSQIGNVRVQHGTIPPQGPAESNRSAQQPKVKAADPSKNWLKTEGNRKKPPTVVSWVPPDYKGDIPDYLNKFPVAKYVFEPAPKVMQSARKVAQPIPKSANKPIKLMNENLVVLGADGKPLSGNQLERRRRQLAFIQIKKAYQQSQLEKQNRLNNM